jgi:hypothetical protein
LALAAYVRQVRLRALRRLAAERLDDARARAQPARRARARAAAAFLAAAFFLAEAACALVAEDGTGVSPRDTVSVLLPETEPKSVV